MHDCQIAVDINSLRLARPYDRSLQGRMAARRTTEQHIPLQRFCAGECLQKNHLRPVWSLVLPPAEMVTQDRDPDNDAPVDLRRGARPVDTVHGVFGGGDLPLHDAAE